MRPPCSLNVIEASSPEVFNLMIYPDQHPGTYQYLQNQLGNISSTIFESGRKLIEESRSMMEKFCDGSIERAARATIRMANNLINPNAIRRYNSLEDIQAASPLMIRYIMSEPYLRDKLQSNLCSGFSNAYIDVEPGFSKWLHYDYRRVNNGIVHFEGEGEDEQWVARNFFEDLREGDRELLFEQKIDILHTQDLAKIFAEAGQDPTNPYGGEIG